MQTGVIYARYSCDKQTENSILGQIRECNLFAERNDIKVIDVYKDEAISGKTALKRPAFMQAGKRNADIFPDYGCALAGETAYWRG